MIPSTLSLVMIGSPMMLLCPVIEAPHRSEVQVLTVAEEKGGISSSINRVLTIQ